MHCEDLDWCKRFELKGWKVAFVAGASVMHAKGVSTQSRPIGVLYTLHTGMNRFIDKFYRTEYRLPLRLLVKLGIIISFVIRSSRALLLSMFSSLLSVVSRK
jgi:GT2 family glycosyltransferase